ncbi:ERV-BabFcenv provirus ancestral Env polyprotein-like [Pyxicephalus adspersus]|uniref:ERV-BabFcenv provirus ancestral Env polyprotein-like n=1 Tax=Pyxicephalus adspersus TaxID=30357 RepID=UPI003B5B67CC
MRRNMWLEWMKYTTHSLNRSNCYVCGQARPYLATVPLHVPKNQDACFLSLYLNKTDNSTNCDMRTRYPLIKPHKDSLKKIPGAEVMKGDYTCYNSTSTTGMDLKNFPNETRTFNESMQNQKMILGDIYWICGNMKMRNYLPRMWKGQCAPVQLLMPLHIIQLESEENRPESVRKKRSAPAGSLDPHVYIDAIGVPRGVPDEYKARDQVAAGFESLFPQITINKNVDWINYIYYNQQRFINFTRDAIGGLAEQLDAVTHTVQQNRMALDMLLAQQGGVCAVLKGTGGTCCTCIPDNTGKDGSVTKALKKIKDLSDELAQNSGVEPWGDWFNFASWKKTLTMFSVIIFVVLIMLAIVSCCVIPCVKKLVMGIVTSSTMYTGLQYSSEKDIYKEIILADL